MVATLLIYVTALVVFAIAGVAVLLLVQREDPRLGSGALPLGACVLAIASHWPGYLVAGRIASVIVLVAAVAALAAAVVRVRRRRIRSPIERIDMVIAGVGALAGVVLLFPLFSLGFPSTIAVSIADGFARSVLTEWLMDNPLSDSRLGTGIDRPSGTYSALPPELGAGFEYLAGMIGLLLRRDGHEVVQVLAATSVPLALCGWIRLLEELSGRRPRVWQVLLLVPATLTPVAVLPYADDYLTQVFSVGLWPFAAAATVAFFRAPSVRTAIVAALGLGAIAAIYPPLLPWVVTLVLAAAVVALVVTGRAEPLTRRLAGLARSLALLGLAVLVLAPLPLVRGWEAATNVVDARSNPAFPILRLREAADIWLGGLTQFQLPLEATTTTGELLLTLALLLFAVVVAAAVAMSWRSARWTLLGLATTVALVSGGLYLKYKFRDDYGYGGYKALLYGGPLFLGLVFVALAEPSRRLLLPRGLAVGACVAIWFPLTLDMLNRQQNGAQGFRAADHALGEAIEGLPDEAAILVEGAVESETSFQMRLDTMYFAKADERTMQGLGTTYSYGSGGGSPGWRPTRPWTHVVASGPSSTFEQDRQLVWEHEPYRLMRAPAVDATPYAVARPESAALAPALRRFWLPRAPDNPEPVDYIAGPVEIVVANRNPHPVTAHVRLTLVSMTRRPRTLRLRARGAAEDRVRVRRGRPTEADYEVPVAAGTTTVVAVDPGPVRLVPDAPPAPLVAVTAVDVDPA
jgi:hypothetical protein